MKKLSSNDIRKIWLDFWNSKQHQIIQSSPLVPVNDPTLLWINAGVAPLKKYFDGSQIPPNKRMANIQKCIRTNDIENVGLTARHHTFFEMLGNFSIGDYFKKEAINWAFELLTSPKYFNFSVDQLYFSYYPNDLDAKKYWLELGVPAERIIPLEECFWEIGEGPCGPCTEVHFDRGPKFDKRGVELLINDIENDRFVEIWNIVFSQYNSKPGLTRDQYPELPNKNIDTGAGLERIAAILQDAKTNFETDLFLPIIKHIEKLSQINYSGQKEFKIIADHIRTIVMALSDGATISNEGRGYVLRRLLRRALKHGRTLNLNKPFLHLLVDDVINIMQEQYPNIVNVDEVIKKIILIEEEKFLTTLIEGEKQFLQVIANKEHIIDGKQAFKLYDTYGFPIELTEEYAHEYQLEVDLDGFYKQLELQKQRSRDSRNNESSMHAQDERFLKFNLESQFIGYDTLEANAKVIQVFDKGIVLDKTPFYAESGGQVSDKGTINGIEVFDVIKLPNGQHLHLVDAVFTEGTEVLAKVDSNFRNQTIKNHSATHLLHKSLKDVLGNHLNQHGSRVGPDSLRFDFNNFEFPSNEQILKVEEIVNQEINKATPIKTKIMPIEEAKKLGAQALFTEKYGDIVRVVDMDYSIELCGGTHAQNTLDIKKFVIASIESIGSGIYRIEAITGDNIISKVLKYLQPIIGEIDNLDDKLSKIAIPEIKFNQQEKPQIIGSYQDIINYRIFLEKYKSQLKEYEKEVTDYKEQQTLKTLDSIIKKIDSNIAVIKLNDFDPSLLKVIADDIFIQKDLTALFLANVKDEKVTFIAKSKVNNANTMIKLASEITNGRGGGKPDFARGGTDNLEKLDEALLKIEEIFSE